MKQVKNKRKKKTFRATYNFQTKWIACGCVPHVFELEASRHPDGISSNLRAGALNIFTWLTIHHWNLKEFNSFVRRTDTLFWQMRRLFRCALDFDTFEHDPICFCHQCDVFQFLFTAAALLSHSIVIAGVWRTVFAAFRHAYFIRMCAYPIDTINRRTLCCLFVKEYMLEAYIVVPRMGTIVSKNWFAPFHVYFYFYFLLSLPMHAVNKRQYVYETFVSNALHVSKGLISVLLFMMFLVAVVLFWHVICCVW